MAAALEVLTDEAPLEPSRKEREWETVTRDGAAGLWELARDPERARQARERLGDGELLAKRLGEGGKATVARLAAILGAPDRLPWEGARADLRSRLASGLARPVLSDSHGSPLISGVGVVGTTRHGGGFDAWLQIEQVGPGRGEFYPAPSMWLARFNPSFEEALANAWTSARGLPGAVDFRWRLECLRQSLSALEGGSLGAACALLLSSLAEGHQLYGRVFVTGAVSPRGEVLPVSAETLPFKARAAKNAGASWFLVPPGQEEEARQGTPGWERVRPIARVADALALLRAAAAHDEIVNVDSELARHRAWVPRPWLEERIRQGLEEHDRGLILVEGEAGTGKSALVSQLVREAQERRRRRPAFHFLKAGMGDWDDPAVALRSLLAQLRSAHACSGDLAEIARGLPEGEREVVFLDGLDVALLGRFRGQSAAPLVPPELPPGVFWLVTSRPGPHLAPLEPVLRISLEEHAVTDLTAFIQERLGQSAELARTVAQRCGGSYRDALSPARPLPADLQPLDFGALLASRREGFCGRLHLTEQIESWLATSDEPALLITGDPGMGKSSLAARLVDRYNRRVLAHHFCQAATSNTLDPARCVRSLAAMLAARLEGLTLSNADTQAPPDVLIESLLLAPLRQLPPPPLGVCAVVVDGLDEAPALLELLAPRLEKGFPAWLRVIVTARREAAVLSRLPGLRQLRMEAQGGRNLADVDEYVRRREALKTKLGPRWEEVCAQIVERSAGNFLYAEQAVLGLERDLYDPADPLPVGLTGQFEAYFARTFPTGLGDARPLLEVVAASLAPLDRDQLSMATGLAPERLNPLLQALSAYLREQQGGYALYHKAVTDWLRRSQYGIDPAQGHRRLASYCQGALDPYGLRFAAAHLAATGATDDLLRLLTQTDFCARRDARLGEPFLEVEDTALLAGLLLKEGRHDELVELALSDNGFRRDGLVLALLEGEHVEPLLERLLTAGNARWPWERRRPVLNARRAALRVAESRGLERPLRLACRDNTPAVRALLVPYLYRYWKSHREPGWRLLEELCGETFNRAGMPNTRALELAGGWSLGILGRHSGEPEVLQRLRVPWQALIKRSLGTPSIRLLGRGWLLNLLARGLGFLMQNQPDFQPINLKEGTRSVTRPLAFHDLMQGVIDHLEFPERGYQGVLERMAQPSDYDVILMMAGERTLIYHGVLDPEGVLEGMLAQRSQFPSWFRPCLAYVGFHILTRQENPPERWLEIQKRLTLDSVTENRATFSTGPYTYPMVPQLAWLELIYEQHRPGGGARFIPEVLRQALELPDAAYAERVLRGCNILCLAYQNSRLALEAARSARESPLVRDVLVEILANVRFYAETQVDQFLEGDAELARRVRAASPNVVSTDFATWIDDFMNTQLVRSEFYRLETVAAFRRAGKARSLGQMYTDILGWGMNLIAGEVLLELAPTR